MRKVAYLLFFVTTCMILPACGNKGDSAMNSPLAYPTSNSTTTTKQKNVPPSAPQQQQNQKQH